RKVFVVQSRGPGGSKRVSLGRYGNLTADKAREKAAAVIDRIKRGEAPKPETARPVTLADLTKRFLSKHVAVHCKPNTQAS
ncbi:MAG: integrase arm-type DNA-binding domain-containing protein, partial [Rhodospirillaceae bacterium]|nr:integrase arm-type DNA-binding domain-containing protein [Rhodospirillaceae bacterium]